jgi:DNA invertase Pin-like site-specific DNA recombinase
MRPEGSKPNFRCAIYTRVSTEQGLKQEFNSLDNQREAGGSMERPALQKLLDDIRARRVDAVVVYKVDRLTRSLADFAKLVELFDAHQVSFVSVTQAFNTTTSMGRLTLNVLLSFAWGQTAAMISSFETTFCASHCLSCQRTLRREYAVRERDRRGG